MLARNVYRNVGHLAFAHQRVFLVLQLPMPSHLHPKACMR